MTILLLLFELLAFYIYISLPSFQNVKDILNRYVFDLTDNFIEERETEFYNNKLSIILLKRFNEEINNNELFKYYEIISSPVYVPSFNNSVYDHSILWI